MALAYTKLKIELREISLKNRPKELYSCSSKGTVPVLITADNIVIDESLDIMLWALKNHSGQTWLSKDCNNELKMINVNDTKFKKWLDKYKYHDRYPDKAKEFYRENCCEFLNVYEMQLSKTRYLLDDKINIADIAIFPFIRQFANVDCLWFESAYNNLVSWLNDISNSELFEKIMKKYSLWTPGESLIIDFR